MNIKKAFLTCSGMLFIFLTVHAQLPTYTVDENFTTNDLFRASGGVHDMHFIGDGRILIGGGFDSNFFGSPFRSLGMIWSNGSIDSSWPETDVPSVFEIIEQDDGYVFPFVQSFFKVLPNGELWYGVHGDWWSDYNTGGNINPYNVESVWTIFQQDDGKLLIGGAIATDTVQPGLFRNLVRIHADGTHDDTFPAIECEPNNQYSSVMKIQRTSIGYWYISGAFEAINGHETNHIARLTPNFEIDTTFVSQIFYEHFTSSYPNVKYVDSQDRLWVSGKRMRLLDNPNDTIQLVRILGDGTIDETFLPRYLTDEYPSDWSDKPNLLKGVVELENHPGKYLLHGNFNRIDGIPQECISVVDDAGSIQDHFFQGQGATENTYISFLSTREPGVYKVVELENGDLLVGGGFSHFMGTTHYNMIKLKLGVLDTENQSALNQKFEMWPNPSASYVYLSFEGLVIGQVKIMNLAGQTLQIHQMHGGILRLDTSELGKGVYFVSLETEDGTAIKKMVVN